MLLLAFSSNYQRQALEWPLGQGGSRIAREVIKSREWANGNYAVNAAEIAGHRILEAARWDRFFDGDLRPAMDR